MPCYIRDPKRDHNVDSHPRVPGLSPQHRNMVLGCFWAANKFESTHGGVVRWKLLSRVPDEEVAEP